MCIPEHIGYEPNRCVVLQGFECGQNTAYGMFDFYMYLELPYLHAVVKVTPVLDAAESYTCIHTHCHTPAV